MKRKINIFTSDNQVTLVREVNNFIDKFTEDAIDGNLTGGTDSEGNEWLTVLIVYTPKKES